MSELNGVISKLQKLAGIEASEYMCRYELGFITEYEISFPESTQCYLNLDDILGTNQSLVKKIVA
jgi:hypothetical protein